MKKMLMMCAVVAAALCARAALPEGGPYTEVVDGIEWTFMVKNGEASVGTPAIPQATIGAIAVPSALGGHAVTSIGSMAFVGCSGLTSVTIPDSVTSIGYGAFLGCSGLTSVEMPISVTNIESRAFDSCGLTSVIIPPTVKTIGVMVFNACRSLKNVSISEGVECIGECAFSQCHALTSVTIPSSVMSIDGQAFRGCQNLTEICVEKNNRNYSSLGGVLFDVSQKTIVQYPGGLRGAYEVPSSVINIGSYAFSMCSGLTGVKMSSGVKRIGKSAFSVCPGLIRVEIPSGVTSIESKPFHSCSNLVEIFVAKNNRSYCSKDGVLFDISQKTLVQYPAGLCGAYEIPSGVTNIGADAFCACIGLTNVTIPSSVLSIEKYAFTGCDGLTNVTIPPSMTSIGECVFSFCSGLMDMSIPSSVASIDDSALLGCETLCVVHVEAGDTKRIRKMLEECWIVDGQTSVAEQVTIVEDYEPEPGPVPPEPEPEEGFEEAHTFNGLACAGEVMCGIVQVTTGKRTAKDQVKVGGFVMLADGKKQTIKSVTEDIEGGKVYVETKAGKLGDVELEITDSGFTGSVGVMTVKSGDIGEDTGIISGTLKMSYFDAKTNKLKTRSIKLGGVASEGEAAGTLTTKGEDIKTFEAVIE